MQPWIRWSAIATMAVAGRMGPPAPTPKAGDPFPIFAARDVTGQMQSTAAFRGKTTLVVAVTDRGGGDAVRAWFEGAHKRTPTVQLKGIISIGIPFIVSESYARARAREKIPKAYWHDNLFDGHHVMAKLLGLPESDVPWAFALDAKGRVLAVAHATAAAPSASGVWKALEAAK